jgi:hypothetical protein
LDPKYWYTKYIRFCQARQEKNEEKEIRGEMVNQEE